MAVGEARGCIGRGGVVDTHKVRAAPLACAREAVCVGSLMSMAHDWRWSVTPNLLLRGGVVAQAAELFIRELRLGLIGRATFELPDDVIIQQRVERGARRGY